MNTPTWIVPNDGTPLDVFHLAWKEIQDQMYEPPKGWRGWEHRFDREICTVEDAGRCIRLMLESLGDRYTRFMSSDEVRDQTWLDLGYMTGIGIQAAFKLDSSGAFVLDSNNNPLLEVDGSGHPFIKLVLPNLPADRAGLKKGDAIVSIDGTSPVGLSPSEISMKILGYANTEIEIAVKRGDQLISASIKRQSLVTNPVQWKLLPDGIGYIKFDDFSTPGALRQVMEAFRALNEARALIFDLRDNPGGPLSAAAELAAMFLPAGKIVRTKVRIAKSGMYEEKVVRLTAKNLIRDFARTQPFKRAEMHSEQEPRVPYLVHGRPVVLLVNHNTASAAEIFTGAVRDNGHAIVIGSCTFGKGIGQATVPLPLGTQLVLTIGRFFTPSGLWLGDGGNTVSQGIIPDFPVALENPFIELGSDQDNQLAFSHKVLLEKLRKR